MNNNFMAAQKPSTPIPGTHFGHHHMPIYALQILLFVAISCSIAYMVFTAIYGKPESLTQRMRDAMTPPVTAEDVAQKKAVNENDFRSQAGAVEEEKLNNLFPEIK